MTVRQQITEAAGQIARRDAEVLLGHVLGRDRAWLLAHDADELPSDAAERFHALVERRAAGEPVQYLTGVQEFYGLALKVTPAVLIPRPETELLVEQVEIWATQFHDGRMLEIADVGTGSGAIALALATHMAGVHLTAIDVSWEALAVAEENARTHKCERRVGFFQADLLTGATAKSFDAIVSNPPYVPAGDAATMQREVVGHEPHGALFAGEDGLEVYRRLIPQARVALKPHGLLAMEFGFGQREPLRELLAAWKDVRFVDDYAGIPRVVLAVK